MTCFCFVFRFVFFFLFLGGGRVTQNLLFSCLDLQGVRVTGVHPHVQHLTFLLELNTSGSAAQTLRFSDRRLRDWGFHTRPHGNVLTSSLVTFTEQGTGCTLRDTKTSMTIKKLQTAGLEALGPQCPIFLKWVPSEKMGWESF